MALTFKLEAATAPPGQQCLTTLQGVLNATAKFITVIGPPGVTVFVESSAEPSVDDRDKVWLKLETNGKPAGIFKYAQTAWVQIPPMPIGTVALWNGLVASIPTGWVLADGTNGAPDLTDNTDFASLWEPNYSALLTTYDLCPIYFKGNAA